VSKSFRPAPGDPPSPHQGQRLKSWFQTPNPHLGLDTNPMILGRNGTIRLLIAGFAALMISGPGFS
jgi:hypothetical protein